MGLPAPILSRLPAYYQDNPFSPRGVRRAFEMWSERPVNCVGCGAPHARGDACAYCGREH